MYVIGLVGPFGSGCSYVAKKLMNSHGYEVFSLSDMLREEYKNDHPNCGVPSRTELQDYGDKVRKEKGADYLARKVSDKIGSDDSKKYVIDSIRNPNEINFLRKKYAEFFLFGIFAEREIRWERVHKKYNDDKREFLKDDGRDGNEKCEYGQRVTDSFRMADIVILNNQKINIGSDNEIEFDKKLDNNVRMIEGNKEFKPDPIETNMCAAYATSLRSSCLKRKVGAVIVDSVGAIYSSGYNEVPAVSCSCKSEYGECYRDKLKNDYRTDLKDIIMSEEEQKKAYNLFVKDFKILDYCRSLHAEENAILNVARFGISPYIISKSTLYTTTYPCNLCANKIAQLGIKEVVYFEPYPMDEAKKTLTQGGVKQTPFEGVTYNGYFRLMEEVF